jgi:hypothetical protein
LPGGLIAVWKFPADLKEINHWVVSVEPVEVSVGTYKMIDDTANFSTSPPLPNNNTNTIWATKTRVDFPKKEKTQAASVHHLNAEGALEGALIPAFSTGHILADFNAQPTDVEKQKVQTLLEELQKAGIKAFMCNGQHHLLVLYKDANGEQITPKDVAGMLKGPSGQNIKSALQKAVIRDFNVEEWAQNYISYYGPKEVNS